MAFAVAACVVAAVPSVLSAVRDARAARAGLEKAVDEVRRGEVGPARRRLATAARRFDEAVVRLGSSWVQPARAVPFVGRQLDVVHALARSGFGLTGAALASADVLSKQPRVGWGLHDGAVELTTLNEAAGTIRRAASLARRAAAEARATPRSWLVPPVGDARATAERTAMQAANTLARAATALRLAPHLLGESGTRRYLVVSSNLAELRGTGGLLGFFALIEAEGGRLRLLPQKGRPNADLPPLSEDRLRPPRWYMDTWGRYEPTRTWHNINMTADFPTAGRLIAEAVSDLPGPIHGVIQIDPYGLASLLSLTGPVELAGWHEPIAASNVAAIAQHELYVRYVDATDRDTFAVQLVAGVFKKMLSSSIRLDPVSTQRLAEAVAGGHIKVYLEDATDQRDVETLHLDGGLKRTEGATDVVGVFTENASPNKVDWFLRRSVRYELRLHPESGTADAKLVVDLHNEAPPSGLPEYILGPNGGHVAPGENRSIVVLLRPPNSRLLQVVVDGKPIVASIDEERHLRAHQFPVLIPPGESVRVEASYSLKHALRADDGASTLALRFLRQPVVSPDRYEVRVIVPRHWQLSGPDAFRGALTEDLVLELRLSRRGLLRFLGPFAMTGRPIDAYAVGVLPLNSTISWPALAGV